MPLPLMNVGLKSLGIIQTMIGAVIFMFGFVIKHTQTLAVRSCSVYWGSVCFFISGVLAISTVDYHHPCLVKFSLLMNVISTVAAGVALVVFSVDLGQHAITLPECSDLESCALVALYEVFLGTFRVLLVFSLLEMCVSIWSFVLIWKARDSTEARS
ncbi:high affinity immunoglobulin epsilon receptor subunit beta-like [Neoarius graeffei]|uniref:high affinity immunoglobulin epsilon receptor subunit beta-like n=1 Tax=Neoarius graeffei TaxID=443677 RepID=UPI00298C664D|nr:high affinity immunoglobulin epsilon receptor subunit beta-like [Neoarius graeffei]XP_060774064.1 high affinity immunoglobulin epsilon receptor subunit beta-like [Neoarius graeffei]